jgi:hypothetical protein
MGLTKLIGKMYPDSRPKVLSELMKWTTEVESVNKSIKLPCLFVKAEFPGIYELSDFIIKFSTGMPVVMPYVNPGVLYLIAGIF